MNGAHRLKASDEAAEAFKALPEGFDAGLAGAFTREKAAKHGDAADHLAHGGRLFGWRFPGREPGRLPFERVKYRYGRQVGLNPRQSGQMCQTPSHHEIERQGEFQLLDVAQLQCLNTATVLEHVKQGFNFPPAAIPVDQLRRRFQRDDRPVGQQAPFGETVSFNLVRSSEHQATPPSGAF